MHYHHPMSKKCQHAYHSKQLLTSRKKYNELGEVPKRQHEICIAFCLISIKTGPGSINPSGSVLRFMRHLYHFIFKITEFSFMQRILKAFSLILIGIVEILLLFGSWLRLYNSLIGPRGVSHNKLPIIHLNSFPPSVSIKKHASYRHIFQIVTVKGQREHILPNPLRVQTEQTSTPFWGNQTVAQADSP